MSQLELLKSLRDSIETQIIEINGFAEIQNSRDQSIETSNSYIQFIQDYLQIEEDLQFINSYGNQKINLNFSPVNWHRVDLYYYVSKNIKKKSTTPMVIDSTIINPTEVTINTEEKVYKTSNLNDIIENVPVVLPIQFIGDKNQIKKESQPYLNHLTETLKTYPNLTVHIRGHVCCGNNMRISKARAKTVYKYLIENGIEKSRLTFKGYSNTQPIRFPELTSEDRSTNRRVDVIFTKEAL
jgi:outer membrane protein OmpA-like peptidoglycan-associated protein